MLVLYSVKVLELLFLPTANIKWKKKCHSAVIFQCQQHPAPVRLPEVFKLISFQFLKKTNYKATNTPFECKLRPLPEPHECIKRNPLWISTWEKHKGLCLLASSFFSLPPLPFTLQQIKKKHQRSPLGLSVPPLVVSFKLWRKKGGWIGPNLVHVNVCGLGSSSPPDKKDAGAGRQVIKIKSMSIQDSSSEPGL